MRHLRSGEWLAAAGALLLAVSLFGGWFAGRSGWSSLGWLALLFALLAVALGAWLVAATALWRPVADQVLAAVYGCALGPVAVLVVLLRVTLLAPGDVGAAAWLGLAGALLVAVGAWRALADERTDAPESAYEPPPPRPAPPVSQPPS